MKVTHQILDPVTRNVQVNVDFAATGQLDQPFTVEWGDGVVTPVATAGSSATHAYGKDGKFIVTVKATDSRVQFHLMLGAVPFPVHDPDKRLPTMVERWALEREKAAAIRQVSDEIGSDAGNSVGPYTVTDPATKQADA